MTQIEYCYDCGDLDKALYKAATLVKKVGEGKVMLIATDYEAVTGWTVVIVWAKAFNK